MLVVCRLGVGRGASPVGFGSPLPKLNGLRYCNYYWKLIRVIATAGAGFVGPCASELTFYARCYVRRGLTQVTYRCFTHVRYAGSTCAQW